MSDISKDQAWFDYMEDQYESGEITLEDWEEAYSELSKTFMVTEVIEVNTSPTMTTETMDAAPLTTNTSTTTTIQGLIEWECDANGTRLPLRIARVELRDRDAVGSQCIAEQYTDTNGEFCFTFEEWEELENGGADVFVRCYLDSETFEVGRGWQSDIVNYYFDTQVVDNVSAGTTATYSCCMGYDETVTAQKAVYVHQGMVVAQRFAYAMGMRTNLNLNVAYPASAPFTDLHQSGFCGGNINEQCMAAIGTDNFNSFDTHIHEYGHFVEWSMGNYGSSIPEVLLNDPTHSGTDDHFAERDDKTLAMNLIWSESWATAFSQIAQRYYATEYDGIPWFDDVCNKKENNENNFYEDLTPDHNSGEVQENAVIAVLWDLFDSGTNESFDTVSWGYQKWWNYTTRQGTYTLTDFTNMIETYYPSNRSGLGMIMAKYQISPGSLTITNQNIVSTSIPPVLSWRVNGSTNNPNNRFQVVFYDKYGNLIYECSPVTSTKAYNDTYSYTVSQIDWNNVLQNYGGTFTVNIAVRAYHTEDPISGPYISQYAPVTLTRHNELTIYSGNRYTEKQIKLDNGGYCDYTVTFEKGGTRVIQTFGTKDTVIELYSSSGTLLRGASDTDDEGYNTNAFLSYRFAPGVQYTIRVRFYGTGTYGTTRLAIVRTYTHDNYEAAYGTYGITSKSFNLSTNEVALFRYKFSSSGNATFTMSSADNQDTYLYVIDPTSTELITRYNNNPGTANLYDDDSAGNYQAQLTKTVQANKEYLVILTFYDPSSTSGEVTIRTTWQTS